MADGRFGCRVLTGILAVLVGTVAAMAQEVGGQSIPELAAERVAVLAFDNISRAAADDWFGAGIAETLAAGLNSHAVFDVIDGAGRRSAMRIGGTTAVGSNERGSGIDIGQRLGVRWVLTGGYQRLGDQLRITARLVDVSTGMVLGATTVDGALAGFFALQDRLVSELVPVVTGAMTGRGLGDQEPRASASSLPAPGRNTGRERAVAATEPLTTVRPTRSATLAPGGGDRVAPAPGVIDGPAPPVPPAIISRDADRRATIRATRLTEEISMDGLLDERVYQTVPALTEFIQQSPDEGAPATERTEAWILFNERNLYAAGRIWDSAPPSEWVANEMRRDTAQLRQNDTFALILDTFYDRRNGVAFYTNALGAIADFALTNEGNPNSDWNPVWDVRTARFEGGWTVEMEIPFRSLRYRPGPDQVWGMQLRRNVRRKNEWAYLTPLPISAGSGPA